MTPVGRFPLTGAQLVSMKCTDQTRAPFFEALSGYVSDQVVGLNMPGHVQGRGAPPEWMDFFGLQGDITQVLGMDDILRPTGPTLQAQQLAAQAYGADDSFFLVNGTTSGIAAMCLATLNPGDTVLVPANAHRSLWNGLTLADAQPVFYPLEWDPQLSLFHGPTPTALESALQANPGCKAVYLTHPNFYGFGLDMQALVQVAHSHGKIVLVDQAWGPHLAFHKQLPPCAVACGADLVVQSTHKLASAMSQGAMLHLRGSKVDRQRLRQALALLLTTSPSTLIVASIDVARRQLALNGPALLEQTLELADTAREAIGKLGFQVYLPPDRTRLLFSGASLGWSGTQIEAQLRQASAVQLELSDPRLCLGLLTIGHRRSDVDALLSGLSKIAELPPRQPLDLSWMQTLGEMPGGNELLLTPRQAFLGLKRTCLFEEAVGRIAGEFLVPYPPGIPLVIPGQRIEQQQLDALRFLHQHGVAIQGAHDPQLQNILVLEHPGPRTSKM